MMMLIIITILIVINMNDVFFLGFLTYETLQRLRFLSNVRKKKGFCKQMHVYSYHQGKKKEK